MKNFSLRATNHRYFFFSFIFLLVILFFTQSLTTHTISLQAANIDTSLDTNNFPMQPASEQFPLFINPQLPNTAAPVLRLDDGSMEHAAGFPDRNTEYAAIWLNRFTPSNGSYPLSLQTISIFWPTSTLIGKRSRLVVYWDANSTGNPENAVLIGQKIITIGAAGRFETYSVNMSVRGPSGDIYIGFEDLWAEAGYTPYIYPVAVDTGHPQHQSWFITNSDHTAPDVNTLTNNDSFEKIDALGLPGNFMIRANEQSGNPPPNPTSVPTVGVKPVAPSNLHVISATQNSLTLGWNDNSSNELHFNVYRWNGSNFEFINATHANATTYLNGSLNCGTNYSYRVTASNDAGESAPMQVDARTSDCAAIPTVAPAPTPRLSFNISVMDMHWESSPRAFEPATLVVKLNVVALPQGNAGYTVDVLFGQDLNFSRPLEYAFDTSDSETSAYITPNRLQNGTFEIRISQLELPTTFSSQMAVTVISDANDQVRGALVRPFSVASSPQAYQECLGLVYNFAGDLVEGNNVLPKGSHAWLQRAISFTGKSIPSIQSANQCGNNTACHAHVLNAFYQDLGLGLIDEGVSKAAGPYGFWAVLGKNLILSSPDIVKCGIWCKDVTWEGIKDLTKAGSGLLNAFITGSPVYPLITNKAGQRSGFLPNGQVVNEIPGAQVFAYGEKRFVLYQGRDAVNAQLVGYAAGTMSVDAVFAGQNGSSIATAYNNVPVAPGMKAILASSDPQAALQIDNDGDGQVDQTRGPDSVENLVASAHTFAETGKTVTGRFWETWQGGRSYDDSLYINGLALTDKHAEVSLTDGKIYQVQWFERARFEAHPENQAPYDVLLGLVGVQAAKERPESAFQRVANPNIGLTWFAQTGHTLGDSSEGGQAIARFWNQLGGLTQFGYPLSQPFTEVNQGNGQSYLVQYFERQRFEYHPENKGTRYEVLLGRLGAEQLNGPPTATPTPTPSNNACTNVPSAQNGVVAPLCGPPGTVFSITGTGFKPGEQVGRYYTSPHNQVIPGKSQSTADANGSVTYTFTITVNDKGNEADLGIWAGTFEGVTSHHKAIVYFRIIAP